MDLGEPIPMPIDHAAILTLSQWFSPSFPIGAFSYSHGLEQAVLVGTVASMPTLQTWLQGALEFGAGRNDVILLAAAYHSKGRKDLMEIDEISRAYAPSSERLQETVLQGGAFAKTTSAVLGGEVLALSYPVAVGYATQRQKLPLDLTAKMFLQAFASNQISAAVRLGCFGQTEAQICLTALNPICDAIAEQALGETVDDLGGSAFVVDLAAMKHETQYSRIFRS